MGTHASTDFVRYNVVEILDRRHNGESCRSIAEGLGVPEHQIWYVMKQTGYEGRVRAKPQRVAPRRTAMNFNAIVGYVEDCADLLEIERSADGEGWIVSIDDMPGEQCCSIEQATQDAFRKWSGQS